MDFKSVCIFSLRITSQKQHDVVFETKPLALLVGIIPLNHKKLVLAPLAANFHHLRV
jgi:hypothetical protein